MLMTFDGMRYVYFGNFTALRPEAVLWRLRTLEDILQERIASLPQRVKMGVASVDQQTLAAFQVFVQQLQTMLLVTSDDDRDCVRQEITAKPAHWAVQVLSLNDIGIALQSIG
jgi:hypothetical protein